MKMKQNICSILSLLLLLFATVACSDDDDKIEVDEEWKAENKAFFEAISNNIEYTEIRSEGNRGLLYYKPLKTGSGTRSIYYNSVINCYYKGELIDGTVFDDKSRDNTGKPTEIDIANMIDGWRTILPYMKEGDEWEIYIPQELGYGKSGKGNVLPYSTLRFIIEVKEIVEQ